MHKFDSNDPKPCSHMCNLVTAHVDGNLSGVAAWYTKTHIAGCKQCQASVSRLISMKEEGAPTGRGAAPSQAAAAATEDPALPR